MRPPESTKVTKSAGPSNAGFSLIELLVVVAVILIIAAIAIPNYMRSKERANESSAVQSLRSIATAEIVYSSTYGIDFSNGLLALSGNGVNPSATSAGLIDETLASGVKSGYNFAFSVNSTDPQGNPSTWSVSADPQVPGTSGQRHFYVDQTCVIRSNDSLPAGPNDTPIQ